MVEFYFNFGVREVYDSSPDAIQENVDKFDYIKKITLACKKHHNTMFDN